MAKFFSIRQSLLLLSLFFLLIGFSQSHAQRGKLVKSTKQGSYPLDTLDKEIHAATGFSGDILGIVYDVDVYRVVYETTEPDGITPTNASGLICIPVNMECPSPICTYGHGLNPKDSGAPTSTTSIYQLIGKGVASNGFIAVLPDYIHQGYESDSGFQAFMDAKSEANATIDLVRAAKTLCNDKGRTFSDQLFLSGYSQGGHSSMATAKEIQTNYSNEFHVAAAAPGGGTYDLSHVAADSLASPTRSTPEPIALCMVARSYLTHYRDSLLAHGLDIFWKDAFKAPYDSLLDMMLVRDNPLLDQSLLDSIPNRMLVDSFYTKYLKPQNSLFRDLLAMNNVYEWAPQMPMRMYHSDIDRENPLDNVKFTLQRFIALGAPDVQIVSLGEVKHPDGGVPHLLFMKEWMKEYVTPCTNSAADGKVSRSPRSYPNPANREITFDLGDERAITQNLQIVDGNGRIVFEKSTFNDDIFTVEKTPDMSPGIYYVLLRQNDKLRAWGITVTR